jgi:hypothetical protein
VVLKIKVTKSKAEKIRFKASNNVWRRISTGFKTAVAFENNGSCKFSLILLLL